MHTVGIQWRLLSCNYCRLDDWLGSGVVSPNIGISLESTGPEGSTVFFHLDDAHPGPREYIVPWCFSKQRWMPLSSQRPSCPM